MHTLTRCVIFLSVFNIVNSDFSSPCPDIFEFQMNGSTVFGHISVPIPSNFKTMLSISVNFDVEMKTDEQFQKQITLKPVLDDLSHVRNIICSDRVIELTMTFPPLQNVPLQIISVTFNNELVCSGESITRTDVSSIGHSWGLDIITECPPLQANPRPTPRSTTTSFPEHQETQTEPMRQDTSKNFPLNGGTVSRQSGTEVECWNARDECFGSTTIPLVAYGIEANKTAYPWLGALYRNSEAKSTFQCGASLITTKHAITAAHCVMPSVEYHLILGRHKLWLWLGEAAGQQIRVSRYLQHENYNNLDNDIAILYLSKEIDCSPKVRPVCLWNDEKAFGTDTLFGHVVGWGTTEDGDPGNYTREIEIPIVSRKECLASNSAFETKLSPSNFCAGRRNGSAPLQGDSGSGFYLKQGETWTIRGLVSKALSLNSGEVDRFQYTIFTDVAQFTSWILTHIED